MELHREDTVGLRRAGRHNSRRFLGLSGRITDPMLIAFGRNTQRRTGRAALEVSIWNQASHVTEVERVDLQIAMWR